MSIHDLSRTRIETEDSVTAGFRCAPRRSMLFLLGLHRFCHVLINSAHDSNPRGCAVSKRRFNQNFNTFSIFMTTNFCVQDWTYSRILENPSFRSGLLLASNHCVFSSEMLHPISFFCIKCEDVLSFFQQSSNQRQSIVWITSDQQTIDRIYAHSLAPKSPVAGISIVCFAELSEFSDSSLHRSAIAP